MIHKFLIIGSGRMARHFSNYCSLLNIPHVNWNRKQDPLILQEYLTSSTAIFLLISDSSIETFYKSEILPHLVKNNLNIPVVHFSGALEITGINSAHPLMTFGPDLYDLEFYKNIPFINTNNFQIPCLPNCFYNIDAKNKSYYHALCVMGGNFTSLLVCHMQDGFQKIGLPADVGNNFIFKSIENSIASGEKSITGPLIRKDLKTISANLKSLNEDNFLNIYRSFASTYVPEFKESSYDDSAAL